MGMGGGYWLTLSHSRFKSDLLQSSGINATLHLTLKWEQVVPVDYRRLITGSRRSEISPEIHFYPIPLIAIYLLVYRSIFLALYPLTSSLPLYWVGWIRYDNPYLNPDISNETSVPLCIFNLLNKTGTERPPGSSVQHSSLNMLLLLVLKHILDDMWHFDKQKNPSKIIEPSFFSSWQFQRGWIGFENTTAAI